MRWGAEDWTSRRTWDGEQEVYREGSEQSGKSRDIKDLFPSSCVLTKCCKGPE